jgi:hypothetical protein
MIFFKMGAFPIYILAACLAMMVHAFDVKKFDFDTWLGEVKRWHWKM